MRPIHWLIGVFVSLGASAPGAGPVLLGKTPAKETKSAKSIKAAEEQRLALREMADELAAKEKEVAGLRVDLMRLHDLGHIVDPDINSAKSLVTLHSEAQVPDKQAAVNEYLEAKASWLSASSLLRAIRLRYEGMTEELRRK